MAKACGKSGGFCLRIKSAHSFHSELSASIWLYMRASELAGVSRMLKTGATRSWIFRKSSRFVGNQRVGCAAYQASAAGKSEACSSPGSNQERINKKIGG